MEGGLEVLKKLHSSDDDPDSHFAQAEFTQIQRQVELDRHNELVGLGYGRGRAPERGYCMASSSSQRPRVAEFSYVQVPFF